MAGYTYNRVRLVFSGKISSVQDWSVGLSMYPTSSATPTLTEMQALATAADSAFNDYCTATGGPQQVGSSDTDYRQCDAYFTPAGSLVATVQGQATRTPHPFAQTAILPDQAALVISLRTNFPGRHGRGRYYLVANGATLVNHQLSDSQTGDMATAAVAFITALNAIPIAGDAAYVAVTPNLVGDFPPRVSKVVVDSKIDSQRRRVDKVAATATHVLTVP